MISLFIIAVLYQKVDAMLGTWGLRIARSTLPNVILLENLFYMYGVFSNVTTHSKRYAAFGSPNRLDKAPASPLLQMKPLDIYRYFPQRRGEAHRRLSFDLPSQHQGPVRKDEYTLACHRTAPPCAGERYYGRRKS